VGTYDLNERNGKTESESNKSHERSTMDLEVTESRPSLMVRFCVARDSFLGGVYGVATDG
jgi:hypothetical protein